MSLYSFLTQDEKKKKLIYGLSQKNGMQVELTSTRRTALHRYTFPPNTKNPRILVDVGNDGQLSCQSPSLVLDPASGRVKGGGSFRASWGPGRFNAYFCVDFRGENYALGSPTEFGAYTGNSATPNTSNLSQLKLGEVLSIILTFITSLQFAIGCS